jgi:hypothetical protein
MDEHYWPFPVTKPEVDWDEFDRDYLDFMRTAFAEGYRPREYGSSTCLTVGEWSTGRSRRS